MPTSLMGFLNHGPDRKRRAASGVAVHLGQDHAADVQILVEFLRHIDRVLAGHGVGHEQDLAGLHGALDLLELVHELLIDMQAAGRIQDDHVSAPLSRHS